MSLALAMLLVACASGPSARDLLERDWQAEGAPLDHLEPVPTGWHDDAQKRLIRALILDRRVQLQMMKFPAFSRPWFVYVTRDDMLAFRRITSRRSEPLRIETNSVPITSETVDALDGLWDAVLSDVKGPIDDDEIVVCTDGNIFEFAAPLSFGGLVARTTNCALPVRMKALAAIGQRMADLTHALPSKRADLERRIREAALELMKHFPSAVAN
ncbi:MAG TPA: hypothetical protein VGH20_10095 [Myxococcales bacterium]|jgi:hypothetical protein